MLATFSTLATTIWPWIPAATVGLKFATELIGFYVTVGVMVRRRRKRRRS